ncbi:MAG TPA: SDR family oxidoreductase [Acidisoma sp.]|nr:SDR family oxidoreductase [Acidisoma sp.]HTI02336.1 SDR family oxidoreductase [Acidisoma sp.]
MFISVSWRAARSRPEELANTFVFLRSDRASYAVGSTYFVDGGMLKTL